MQRSNRYSITLSPRSRIDVGTVMPRALAVLRFITSSNLVGCSTGLCAPILRRWAYVNFRWTMRAMKASYDAIGNARQNVKVKYDPAKLFRVNQNIHRASKRAQDTSRSTQRRWTRSLAKMPI
jgi:hypothetical protein